MNEATKPTAPRKPSARERLDDAESQHAAAVGEASRLRSELAQHNADVRSRTDSDVRGIAPYELDARQSDRETAGRIEVEIQHATQRAECLSEMVADLRRASLVSQADEIAARGRDLADRAAVLWTQFAQQWNQAMSTFDEVRAVQSDYHSNVRDKAMGCLRSAFPDGRVPPTPDSGTMPDRQVEDFLTELKNGANSFPPALPIIR